MKKRILTVLCALSLLIGAFGIVAAANDGDYVAELGGEKFVSWNEVITYVQAGGEGLIKLKTDIEETVDVPCDLYVDLAGHSIAGINVAENCTFYGMDSATNDLTTTEGGKILSKGSNGAIQAISVDDNCSDHSYLMVRDETDRSYAFHCVNLELVSMKLRCDEVGLYFTSNFGGNAVVADRVESFGVALSATEEPNASNLETDCQLSEFFGFRPGMNEDGNSTLLYGIMKETNPYLTNKRNANRDVYGRAYVKLKDDGGYIFGKAQSRSLRQQVETFCRTWNLQEAEDQTAAYNLYTNYTYVMSQWDAPALIYHEQADLVGQKELQDWYAAYEALGVANESMTPAEARKLAVDTFRLQLTFPWIPNENFIFKNANNQYCSIKKDTVYSGVVYGNNNKTYIANDGTEIPYATVCSGNLYKMLKYHDKATGILDIKAMGDYVTVFNTIANQCHRGVSWPWGRVCNSTNFRTWGDCHPSNGAILVGPYTFDENDYKDAEGNVALDTLDIIEKNGFDIMCQSYAAALPGDGLVSDSAGHIMMCSVAPTVVYKNGAIDPDNSYLYILDQGQGGTRDLTAKYYNITQSNGVNMRPLGSAYWEDYQVIDYVNKKGDKMTFAELLDAGYIPFTLPEFTGEDPVETPDAWVGASNQHMVSGNYTIALDTLIQRNLWANYAISHVRYEVRDADGNVVLSQEPDLITHHFTKTLHLYNVLDEDLLRPYTDGKHTIHIDAFLSTGQWVEAFWRTLTS